jgi:hypothetical protein
MTDKTFIAALLDGCFIMKRNSIDKRFGYATYTGNMNVVEAVSNIQFKRHRDYLKGTDRFTLNLSKVRQLHGKKLAKKLYKQHLKNINNGNTSK